MIGTLCACQNVRPILPDKRGSLHVNEWKRFDLVDKVVHDELFKRTRREGEEGLMVAMLRSAIEDFQKYVLPRNQAEQRLFQDAANWLLDNNTEWIFSFENICERLELDPGALRWELLRWRESRLGCTETKNRSGDVRTKGHKRIATKR